MKRPKNWYELPYPIRETLADSCELKYNGYDSSHAEALNDLLCNSKYWDTNNKIVQSQYEKITDERLTKIGLDQIKSLRSQIDEIIELVDA